MTKYDYLIIGQGLAGSLFAHQLIKNNHSFKVIDAGIQGASHICGGMYNPVVLRRYAEVWQAQLQIDTAKEEMKELETFLDKKLDYPQPIYRLFNNENDKFAWQKKSKTLVSFLSETTIAECHPNILSPFGLGEVKMSGRIDTKTLLSAFKEKLLIRNQLIEKAMDYTQLKVESEGFIYEGDQYQHVICCEGFGIKQNPFFNNLPLNGNKGETLYIKAPNLDLAGIVKCGIFIAPTPKKSIYLVGATYDWNSKDTQPTQQAKSVLVDKLKQFLRVDFEVISHQAGIRPTVSDRRPLVGEHPEIKNLFILNGLGTRGIMLAPTMVGHLYSLISEKKPLPEEINIRRMQ